MKNIDKIRQMNSEELAEILTHHLDKCDFCTAILDSEECTKNFCVDNVKQWLEQEVEE